jgi:sulfur-oxidizing protein SoxZ
MVARIIVPANIAVNKPFEVRILIQHPMETGFRQDMMGSLIAKNVISSLSVTFNSEVVFKGSLGTGIAANPSLQFWMKASQSGTLKMVWEDDLGVIGEIEKSIEIKV